MNVNLMLTDSGQKTKNQEEEYEFLAYCKENNIQTYYSADAAAEAWVRENRALSKNTERMSYIYEEHGHYFYTSVYTGTGELGPIHANVAVPTFLLEVRNYLIGDYKVVAHIHSHPEPGSGFHNDYPSMDPGIIGGDRLATESFGYQEMYIVPYRCCKGTNPIIKISDSSTWCMNHPYQ